MKENFKKGFSMIELIIVIAIMAILVALIGTQLIPYIEKARGTRDLDSLEVVYSAYSYTVAESDHPETVTLSDEKVLKISGFTSKQEMDKILVSSQLKGSSVQCFYKNISGKELYGVYVAGKNGYTGVQIDSRGVSGALGVKGSANTYYDNSKRSAVTLGSE